MSLDLVVIWKHRSLQSAWRGIVLTGLRRKASGKLKLRAGAWCGRRFDHSSNKRTQYFVSGILCVAWMDKTTMMT